ncbi:uncharacterized protein LOC134536009 [Bacillus rossius redtenbacheri]|uniref:uncharacterized protein LOC134536009 n=1 Tax=Bacillus rossius redtenbacheri TaxID=93214 RepID=UPI002FDE690F
MRTVRWSKKRIFYTAAMAVVLYFLLCARKQSVTFETIVHNSKAVDVWEFVADFSNMKKLNPTMLDFDILSESGNYDHWRYSAQYTEFLSHLPFVHNTAQAHFSVRPSGDAYVIQSTHTTCFAAQLYCLKSSSEFWFSPTGGGTNCTERVTYECPLLLGPLCRSEVMYQRTHVMDNLKKHFVSLPFATASM